MKINQDNFWHNKRVLVTGCSGFKGSWLCSWLSSMQADVHGYALPAPTTPRMFELLQLPDKINFIEGDICDYAKFKTIIDHINPQIVFHLAAQPLVRYSYAHPLETYHTNVLGLVNVLEAIRHNIQVAAVVNITSDKCYANQEWVWGYRECEPMGGYDPYSNSKGCAELVTSCYQQSYFATSNYKSQHNTLLASARAGNVIGGGDWAQDRLIPDSIRSILHDQPIIIRNPTAIRPWQHVLESLSGYLQLAQRLYLGETNVATSWNFGPDDVDVQPVEYIVNNICRLWGDNASWQIEDTAHKLHEAQYLKLDCAKAKTYLQWRPRWNLQQALEKVVQWYREYYMQGDLYALTMQQIAEYAQAV